MTPHEIDLLMHYYTRADDHRSMHCESIDTTPNELAGVGLLEPLPQRTEYGATWRLTERGEVYCVALTRVPLPVKRWVMPDGSEAASSVSPSPAKESEKV